MACDTKKKETFLANQDRVSGLWQVVLEGGCGRQNFCASTEAATHIPQVFPGGGCGATLSNGCNFFFKSLIFEEWGKPDDTEHQTILNGQSLVIPIDDEGVE